jgi:hypothetical protein
VDRIYLVVVRGHWQAALNTVIDLWVHKRLGIPGVVF